MDILIFLRLNHKKLHFNNIPNHPMNKSLKKSMDHNEYITKEKVGKVKLQICKKWTYGLS